MEGLFRNNKVKQRFRSGGLAAWSIKHPIGISMLALTMIIIGLFSLQRLGIDLLPHIIFPEIRVRVLEPGVPASIMEDRVTRQLEEQLAITEGAIQVQSRTREGRSAVDLSFPYGTDIDIALRDASTRLDRAKRFLPEGIEPPVIYKRDPSQIAIMELIVSSDQRDAIELREWADYSFSKWFLNLPGVAAVEVGGGLIREIQIIADQERLAGTGLDLLDLMRIIQNENKDSTGGRLLTSKREISLRNVGRVQSIEELKHLPLRTTNAQDNLNNSNQNIELNDVARIIDTHADERLRIRLNKSPGVKLSIQKQPQANTTEVVENVNAQLDWMRAQNIIPDDVAVTTVGDQSIFIKHALKNAELAALSGATLAMIVVYLFLGSLKRTLIIGSAIPIGILVTFTIMELNHLTLNIMTLGGLALGLGLLIDSTIVMLENITRHQHDGGSAGEYAVTAAAEVNSPIIASTVTNLAAITPFLFIGGLTGLLFQELIITITSAMVAALVVALTLVPALGSKIKHDDGKNIIINKLLNRLKEYYHHKILYFIKHPLLTFGCFALAFLLAIFSFGSMQKGFLPKIDEGTISVSIKADSGTQLDEMDAVVNQIEDVVLLSKEVQTVFTTAGGFVFGRSEYERSNRSSLRVQLIPSDQRNISSEDWIKTTQKSIESLNLTGYKVRMYVRGMSGFRIGSGDDDISLRIQGSNIDTLTHLGAQLAELIKDVKGLRNVESSYEDINEELKVIIDRQRASDFGISADKLGKVIRIALEGLVISDYLENDRQFDIRLRLPRKDISSPQALENLLVGFHQQHAVRLGEIAHIERGPAPSRILHDQQQRIAEVTASLDKDADLTQVMDTINERIESFELPEGYRIYDGGSSEALHRGQTTGIVLLALAVFLVFVAMSVQYESLLNPLVIMFSIPFTLIGVTLGLSVSDISLTMPVWLGLIMLAGIVVNNSIMLVEQIEIERQHIDDLVTAITTAASLRLRPILMTTLTTVFGMLPLALGLGEGSEMLQPLAYVIVWGLSFSMFVSLILVPTMYKLLHSKINYRISP